MKKYHLPNHPRAALARRALLACLLVIGSLQLGCGAPDESDPSRAVASSIATIARQAKPGNRVIFVGLDGADWSLLDPYMAKGAMPSLERLVDEGQGGVLWSLRPALSPLVWTTIMTGTSPLEHEVLDFARFNPVSGIKEPITADERKVPAIWNMLTYAGKSTTVLGLWATYPAEPIRGLVVSDRLFSFLFHEDEPPSGVAYPPGREAWARAALERAEETVDFDRLSEYLPWLSRAEFEGLRGIDDPYSHPVSALRRILIETELYHALAMDSLGDEQADLTVIYLQGTDSIGHVFAPYAPPRQQEVTAEDYQRYNRVPELYFRYVDRLLGEYRARAEATGSILMLASDHGFKWHEGRPTHLSSFAGATAAKWHLLSGIYLLWGPGVESTQGHGGQGKVAQVCATLMDLLGLPPGRRVTGPSLLENGSDDSEPIDYRSHYRPVEGVAVDAAVAERELDKLRALGYLGTSEAESAELERTDLQPTWTSGAYNNAGLLLRAEGRPEKAQEAFEHALDKDPNQASALWNLSDHLFQDERDVDRSDELLIRALANGLPEGVQYLVGRAIGYQRADQVERSLALLERAVEVRPDESELWLFRGRYRIGAGACRDALTDFQQASRLAPENPAIFASVGVAHLCLEEPASAARAFRQSLSLDPNQPQVQAYLRQLQQ
ncbi:MAG: tetratricopeptide repeat protein [bacterium]|nr:tetratricopeptide repeat protein [bacterium]